VLVAVSRWFAPNPVRAGTAAPEASDCGDEPCEDLRLAA